MARGCKAAGPKEHGKNIVHRVRLKMISATTRCTVRDPFFDAPCTPPALPTPSFPSLVACCWHTLRIKAADCRYKGTV